MATMGSYARFFVGLGLSIEIVREVVMGDPLSIIAMGLAGAFLALTLAFLIFRF